MTDKEVKIFQFLVQVLKDNSKDTTLRVAGGWVRDKLLGKHSDDIDIALDNMYGEEFAAMIREKQIELDPGLKEDKKTLKTNKINLETPSTPFCSLIQMKYLILASKKTIKKLIWRFQRMNSCSSLMIHTETFMIKGRAT